MLNSNHPQLSLQCLYCERTFRDQATLRSHMRKKKHFKLKHSSEYDKYYVINYTDTRWGQVDHGNDDDDDRWLNQSFPCHLLYPILTW